MGYNHSNTVGKAIVQSVYDKVLAKQEEVWYASGNDLILMRNSISPTQIQFFQEFERCLTTKESHNFSALVINYPGFPLTFSASSGPS